MSAIRRLGSQARDFDKNLAAARHHFPSFPSLAAGIGLKGRWRVLEVLRHFLHEDQMAVAVHALDRLSIKTAFTGSLCELVAVAVLTAKYCCEDLEREDVIFASMARVFQRAARGIYLPRCTASELVKVGIQAKARMVRTSLGSLAAAGPEHFLIEWFDRASQCFSLRATVRDRAAVLLCRLFCYEPWLAYIASRGCPAAAPLLALGHSACMADSMSEAFHTFLEGSWRSLNLEGSIPLRSCERAFNRLLGIVQVPSALEDARSSEWPEDRLRSLKMCGGMLMGWAPPYSGDAFPQSMQSDAKLRKKMRAVPEEFYKLSNHPLVSPDTFDDFLFVHRRWMRLMGQQILWHVQERWSGSARSSRVAHQKELQVGFPVDCRYGWDLKNSMHRSMLDQCDHEFGTRVHINAPECTVWSVACTTKDPHEKQKERESQMPMWEWLHDSNGRQLAKQAGFVNEQPWRAASWEKTALKKTTDNLGVHPRKGCHCAHGAVCHESLLPLRKESGWQSPLVLKRSVLDCPGCVRHGCLSGQSAGHGIPKTSLAMVYPEKLCHALDTLLRRNPARGLAK